VEDSERPSRTAGIQGLRAALATEFPERTNRPIWNALRAALLEQAERVDRLPGNQLLRTQGFECLGEIATALESCIELVRWIQPDEPLTVDKAIEASSSWIRQEGMQDSVRHLFKRIGRRPRRGRPITRRDLAIQALEVKLADRTITWSAVAGQLCRCGKPAHDKKCAEAIRRDVCRLNEILRQYSIQIPS
jgi:hypothetical protein